MITVSCSHFPGSLLIKKLGRKTTDEPIYTESKLMFFKSLKIFHTSAASLHEYQNAISMRLRNIAKDLKVSIITFLGGQNGLPTAVQYYEMLVQIILIKYVCLINYIFNDADVLF